MLDHLNLADIRAELERKAARQALIRRVVKYINRGILILAVPLIINLMLSDLVGYLHIFDYMNYIFGFAIILLLINSLLSIILFYRDDRERAMRANAILPALLPNIPIQAHARKPWFETGSVLIVGAAIIWGFKTREFFYTLTFILVIAFLLRYAPRYWLRLEIRWLYKGALARGDYDAALRRADSFLRWMPHRLHYLNAKAFMLLLAGRSTEAEAYCRQILPRGQGNPLYLTAFMVNLGAALLQQQRYDEAFPLVEAAAEIMPENREYYVILAGCYLEQHIQAERALDLLEYALEGIPQPKTNHYLEGYSWSTRKAAEARAAALTGRATRAEAALEAALGAADSTFLPGVADIHVQAGYMRLSQGDFAAAREQFSRAHDLDPNGYSGKLAAQELGKAPFDS